MKLKGHISATLNQKRHRLELALAMDMTEAGVGQALINNMPNGSLTRLAALIKIKELLNTETIGELLEMDYIGTKVDESELIGVKTL